MSKIGKAMLQATRTGCKIYCSETTKYIKIHERRYPSKTLPESPKNIFPEKINPKLKNKNIKEFNIRRVNIESNSK
tara:strand:- start:17 stop:244 length:228 start_codon:yes stop_codon:yes gene_type:complete